MGANETIAAFLRGCTLEERERIGYEAHSTALYLGEEVVTVQSAEEEAVLAAAPLRDLAALNGINIGAGGRPVHPTLLMVDAHRGFGSEGAALPSAQKAPLSTIMAWADDLPFKQGSLDYAISLHNLEHLPDPVGMLQPQLQFCHDMQS
ncbi:hypothetical protein MNEG_1399 [Monoraphidium neglectum]|uniref:Methyltransferase type 11 domain-containing protein n=1 Tax=Monoraphidium neglectum TaxID=145388 RepID=A0A0D2NQF0_9CHLO|nr:hypothetical protein MNEG_1399 [Monoraphidium neglectum]KIZ06556.1 hypothetical protein MNEG_1399 [Monoraphidium neglectum]|eukprot:XP_013905575.1 hypothetical protein MNEG_1399 [Monoraphidium neglectum]